MHNVQSRESNAESTLSRASRGHIERSVTPKEMVYGKKTISVKTWKSIQYIILKLNLHQLIYPSLLENVNNVYMHWNIAKCNF